MTFLVDAFLAFTTIGPTLDADDIAGNWARSRFLVAPLNASKTPPTCLHNSPLRTKYWHVHPHLPNAERGLLAACAPWRAHRYNEAKLHLRLRRNIEPRSPVLIIETQDLLFW